METPDYAVVLIDGATVPVATVLPLPEGKSALARARLLADGHAKAAGNLGKKIYVLTPTEAYFTEAPEVKTARFGIPQGNS